MAAAGDALFLAEGAFFSSLIN